jgi:hypothetical protein
VKCGCNSLRTNRSTPKACHIKAVGRAAHPGNPLNSVIVLELQMSSTNGAFGRTDCGLDNVAIDQASDSAKLRRRW